METNKKLAGHGIQNERYHQFLEGTRNTEFLANRVNDFFTTLTDHFQPLTPPVSSTQILVELLVTEEEVYQSLPSINTTKAVEPDDIPNKLLKDFSFELAPVIKDIYKELKRNSAINSHFWLWVPHKAEKRILSNKF